MTCVAIGATLWLWGLLSGAYFIAWMEFYDTALTPTKVVGGFAKSITVGPLLFVLAGRIWRSRK